MCVIYSTYSSNNIIMEEIKKINRNDPHLSGGAVHRAAATPTAEHVVHFQKTKRMSVEWKQSPKI